MDRTAILIRILYQACKFICSEMEKHLGCGKKTN